MSFFADDALLLVSFGAWLTVQLGREENRCRAQNMASW